MTQGVLGDQRTKFKTAFLRPDLILAHEPALLLSYYFSRRYYPTPHLNRNSLYGKEAITVD